MMAANMKQKRGTKCNEKTKTGLDYGADWLRGGGGDKTWETGGGCK